ncbi:hypothetical protein HLH17_06845 [Acinetobacter sp. ANC 5380]|uniref:Uncharacterized protein n=1 Tax=Acinetobacter terrae TaxID=2731247 RepID=A0A7Y2WAL4_9GAMM|nr:hypothetical protein [Acinetobacter terrae]NNH77390.1 hypothetical protein [Acinetobacter terrae]
MATQYEKDKLNAEQIIHQLSPELSYKFKQEPELKYKRLRLGMIQTALLSENSVDKLNSLMEENRVEIDALMEQCGNNPMPVNTINDVES